MKKCLLVAQSRASLLPVKNGDCLSKRLDSKFYSDRGFAIGFGSSRNIVILDQSDSYVGDWMLNHFSEAGLGKKPEVFVGGINDFNLGSQTPKQFHPFIFYPIENQFLPNPQWLNIVKETDDKNTFTRLCAKMGVPTPRTHLFNHKSELKDFSVLPYPAVLKISTEGSFTGRGVFFCKNSDELNGLLSMISDDISFQIQEDLRPFEITYLNLQYQSANNLAFRLKLTDQILGGPNGKEHIGNSFNCETNLKYYDAWSICDNIAQYMCKKGIQNIFAFDVAVIKRNNKLEYLMVECNPRYNGSSTPTIIAEKLRHRGPWVAKPFELKKELNQISLGELTYQSKRQAGVVLHITSTAKSNTISATILAREKAEIQRYSDALATLLS